MFDPATEELQAEYNAFPNEFAAAFDLSRRESSIVNQTREAMALAAEGKFVVTSYCTHYCGFTDATIGVETRILSVHATREQADAALADLGVTEDTYQDDSGYGLYTRRPVAAAIVNPSASVFDDCPF